MARSAEAASLSNSDWEAPIVSSDTKISVKAGSPSVIVPAAGHNDLFAVAPDLIETIARFAKGE